MKTIILSLLFMGSSFALFSQTDTTRKDTTGGDTDSVNTIRSTGSYGAYGSVAVPSTVQSSFMSQYPTAGNAMWDRDTATNMWRARYNASSRNISVYMDERGNTYTLALPLAQSLVSEDVISSAINKFGNNVYDVLQLKTGDSQYVYQVRLIENGQVRAVHINEDGSDAAYTHVVHTDATDSAANMNNSNNNMNNNNTNVTDTSGNWNNNSGNMTDSTNMQNNNMQNNSTNPDNSTNYNDGTNNLNDQDQSTETLNNTTSDQGTGNTNTNTNLNSTNGLNNGDNSVMESTNNTNNSTNTNTNTNTNNSTGTGTGTNTNPGTNP